MLKKVKYVIYALSNPQDSQVRYIGMSHQIKERFKQHLKAATKLDRNGNFKFKQHLYTWIRSLLKQQLLPKIEIVEEANSYKECLELEKFYILHLKQMGCKLVNLTEGGEEVPGYIPPKYTSKEQDDEICELYKNGNSIDRISEKFGFAPLTVSKVLKNNEIELRKVKRIKIFDLKLLKDQYESGISLTKLSKMYDSCISNIYHNLNMAGAKIRSRAQGVLLSYNDKTRKSTKFTHVDCIEAYSLYKEGRSLNEVGKIYKVSGTYISDLFEENSLPKRGRNRRF